MVCQGHCLIHDSVAGAEFVRRRRQRLECSTDIVEERVQGVRRPGLSEERVEPGKKLGTNVDLRPYGHFGAQLLLQEYVDFALYFTGRNTGRDAAGERGDGILNLVGVTGGVGIGDVACRKIDPRVGHTKAGQGNA